MQFNVKKCKVMHFGRGNPQYEYFMAGEKLQCVDDERDIGVTVTKNLKPGAQCLKAAGTARTVLGQISRSFHYRDKNTFVKLYVTYVRPHLEFCTPVWSPWTKADQDCVENVQKKMVGMISGLKSANYEEKLAEIGLESLDTRRRHADIYTMHKIMHGVGDIDSSVWFSKITGSAVTRAGSDPLNVKCNNGNLELRRNFFSNRVIKDWNAVPIDIKSILIPGKFRLAYRRWLDGGRVAQRQEQQSAHQPHAGH
jgi:hypothetical protein